MKKQNELTRQEAKALVEAVRTLQLHVGLRTGYFGPLDGRTGSARVTALRRAVRKLQDAHIPGDMSLWPLVPPL